MTEEASKEVWEKAGYSTTAVNDGVQEELYEMLRELRRLQFIARKADQAVLTQYCRLWEAYETKCEKLKRKKDSEAEKAKLDLPDSPTGIVRLVVNGEQMTRRELRQKMVGTFGDVLTHDEFDSGLANLVRMQEAIKIGQPGNFRFVKRLAIMLFLMPILFGCSTARRTPDQIPAAIMPRMPSRMPDAPRPAEVVVKAPTTRSYALSWTHDPSPGLLTYRVDYGLSNTPLTNSLVTSANNCTIRRLALDRTYVFHVVGCDGKRYSELENLHLVIK